MGDAGRLSTGCWVTRLATRWPGTVMKDGQQVTIQQALGEHYQPIEEGKADITSPLQHDLPAQAGRGSRDDGGSLRRLPLRGAALVRFGPASAYGLIRSAAWNYFVEKEALVFDASVGKFHVDMEKMPQAVEDPHGDHPHHRRRRRCRRGKGLPRPVLVRAGGLAGAARSNQCHGAG